MRAPTLPTSGISMSNGEQTCANEGPGYPVNPELAQKTMELSSSSNGFDGRAPHAATNGNLEHAGEAKSSLETASARDQPISMRSAARVQRLRSIGAQHFVDLSGFSPGARMTASIVAEFTWSKGTEFSLNSQWTAWLQLYASDGQIPLNNGRTSLSFYWMVEK